MAPDLTHTPATGETQQEGNLLIEAVSLLVQRQRETETWVSEHLWQVEQRAIESERRYAELESRLAGIESHLAHLVGEVEPSDDARVARLRQQIQDLKGEQPLRVADDYPHAAEPFVAGAGPVPSGVSSTAPGAPPVVEPVRQERIDPVPVQPSPADTAAPPPLAVASSPSGMQPASTAQSRPDNGAVSPIPSHAATAASSPSGGSNVSFWQLLGSTREDRFGVVLIGLGGVAVLYALLSQLRFG